MEPGTAPGSRAAPQQHRHRAPGHGGSAAGRDSGPGGVQDTPGHPLCRRDSPRAGAETARRAGHGQPLGAAARDAERRRRAKQPRARSAPAAPGRSPSPAAAARADGGGAPGRARRTPRPLEAPRRGPPVPRERPRRRRGRCEPRAAEPGDARRGGPGAARPGGRGAGRAGPAGARTHNSLISTIVPSRSAHARPAPPAHAAPRASGGSPAPRGPARPIPPRRASPRPLLTRAHRGALRGAPAPAATNPRARSCRRRPASPVDSQSGCRLPVPPSPRASAR